MTSSLVDVLCYLSVSFKVQIDLPAKGFRVLGAPIGFQGRRDVGQRLP